MIYWSNTLIPYPGSLEKLQWTVTYPSSWTIHKYTHPSATLFWLFISQFFGPALGDPAKKNFDLWPIWQLSPRGGGQVRSIIHRWPGLESLDVRYKCVPRACRQSIAIKIIIRLGIRVAMQQTYEDYIAIRPVVPWSLRSFFSAILCWENIWEFLLCICYQPDASKSQVPQWPSVTQTTLN